MSAALCANEVITLAGCSHCSVTKHCFGFADFCFFNSGTEFFSFSWCYKQNNFIYPYSLVTKSSLSLFKPLQTEQSQSLPEALSSLVCGTVPLCGSGEPGGASTRSRKACHWMPPCLLDRTLEQVFPLKRRFLLIMLTRDRTHHCCVECFNILKGY